ncbi:MAG: hypothetical protein ED859_17830 [Desulfuromonadales bacterium]|nr:MAG: hypothetical protein ED859_17830 [Desulfuromonadales bacterium]
MGFRKADKNRGRVVDGGAAGTAKSAVFRFDSGNIDIYLQGKVRRRYLLTDSEKYVADGPNLLTFWVKLPPDSPLIAREELVKAGDLVVGHKKNDSPTMTIMTYHWRQGDMGVGGPSNQGLMTDSNMHGYSEFRFTDKAAGKWVKVVLSPSAFRMSRNYYHFYGANAITDDLGLFSSMRQLQFRVKAKLEKPAEVQIDEIRMETAKPTAVFNKGFHAAKVAAKGGDYVVPLTIRNPSSHDRRYRVIVSSFLGAERELLNKIAAMADDLTPMREIQAKVGGDGGIGVVELIGDDGKRVSSDYKEIVVPAGGVWKGKMVHHIKPEMLGSETIYRYRDYEFPVKRDTLTTSVILWDPADPANKEIDFIAVNSSNADDGNHSGPPGFPEQVRPPEGWRSENVPCNQVGGYFVSVLTLN